MVTFCDPITARKFFTQTGQFSFNFFAFYAKNFCASNYFPDSSIPSLGKGGCQEANRLSPGKKVSHRITSFQFFNICILTKTDSKQRTLKGVNYLVISITFLVLKCKVEVIHPLMTAIGLSFIVFLLIPAAWHVSTTSVTFL